jgi:hypothetical protein
MPIRENDRFSESWLIEPLCPQAGPFVSSGRYVDMASSGRNAVVLGLGAKPVIFSFAIKQKN